MATRVPVRTSSSGSATFRRALERVRALGGDIGEYVSSDDDDTVARLGRFQTCKDDQGSIFGLHQPPA